MKTTNKIINNDQFIKEYNRKNTELTLCMYTLTTSKNYIVHLEQFIDKSANVAEILIKYKKHQQLLSFYLWVRKVLASEFYKHDSGIDIKIFCKKKGVVLTYKIKRLCMLVSKNMVVPFLKPLAQYK